MADFEKIAQFAVPTIAGVAAAFDPYRQVARGLSSAAVMRSQLKGQADREAHRQKMEERAEADQKMQEQRQAWASQQYEWSREAKERADKDIAQFDLLRKDLIAASPPEFHQRLKAATSIAQLMGVKSDIEKLQQGRDMVAAMKEVGIPLTPQLEETFRRNPGLAGVSLQAWQGQQMRQQETMAREYDEYRKAYRHLLDLKDKGEIDAIEFQDSYTKLAVNAPGPLHAPQEGPLVTQEEIAKAMLHRRSLEAQSKGFFDRADYLFAGINEQVAPWYIKWQQIKEDENITDYEAEVARNEMQMEVNRLYKPYLEASAELVGLGYQPKGMFQLEPRASYNADSGTTSVSVGRDRGMTPPPKKKEKGATPTVSVAGHGYPPGMDSSEYVKKYVEEIGSLAE